MGTMATKRRTVRERKAPVKYFKEESSSEDEGEEEEVKGLKVGKVGGGDKSLCLSESDSSDDEKTNVRILQKKDIVSVVANTDGFGKFSLFDEDVEEESLSSQKLLALAGNLEKMKDVWKEKENLDTNSVENITDAKEKIVS